MSYLADLHSKTLVGFIFVVVGVICNIGMSNSHGDCIVLTDLEASTTESTSNVSPFGVYGLGGGNVLQNIHESKSRMIQSMPQEGGSGDHGGIVSEDPLIGGPTVSSEANLPPMEITSGSDVFAMGPRRLLFTLGERTKIDDNESELVCIYEVKINPEVLVHGEFTTIIFPTPRGGLTIDLKPISNELLALPEGQSAWVDEIGGSSRALIMLINGLVEARVQFDREIYRLRSMTSKSGVFEIFDERRFSETPNDVVIRSNVTGEDGRVSGEDSEVSGDSSCKNTPDRVDIMVFYTSEAREGVDGEISMIGDINFAIGLTNTAYSNSGVAHRLRLVHTAEISYPEFMEGITSEAEGQRFLQGFKEFEIAEIDNLRNLKGADLVSLIYEKGKGFCGFADFPRFGKANAKQTNGSAFSIVKRDCASVQYSLAHETGHNFGADHDRGSPTSGSVFNYSFGYTEHESLFGKTWRTIMSYGVLCGGEKCGPIAHFSNPDVNVHYAHIKGEKLTVVVSPFEVGKFTGELEEINPSAKGILSKDGLELLHVNGKGVPYVRKTGIPLSESEPAHNALIFAENAGEVGLYRCESD